jgi:hypothetical protein
MADVEPLWIPLVDEPIGSIVEQIQAEDPTIADVVNTPRKLVAFRTFAYIRVGVLLGQLLVENDVPDYDGSETWVETLLRDPRHRAAVAAEIRAVAEEVGNEQDPTAVPIGPDEAARERFREFARKQLS